MLFGFVSRKPACATARGMPIVRKDRFPDMHPESSSDSESRAGWPGWPCRGKGWSTLGILEVSKLEHISTLAFAARPVSPAGTVLSSMPLPVLPLRQ